MLSSAPTKGVEEYAAASREGGHRAENFRIGYLVSDGFVLIHCVILCSLFYTNFLSRVVSLMLAQRDGGIRVKGHQSGALLSLCQQGRPQPIYLPISLEQAWCDHVCQHVGSIVRATWREMSGLCVGIASVVQSS